MPRRSKTSPSHPSTAGLVNEDAAQVLRGFRQVFNAVKTHFQQLEKRSGLGGAQIWALSVIREQPGIGTGALAQAMDVHQSTASNLVKGLLERELITAKKSGTDRRNVELSLAPAGRSALKKAPAPFSGVLPDALSQLDSTTLKSLHRDLSKLLAALKKVDKKSAQIPLADL
jgi:DNA-binding MarR family transcriptional regulator